MNSEFFIPSSIEDVQDDQNRLNNHENNNNNVETSKAQNTIVNNQMASLQMKLRSEHKCLAKLNVTIILDGKIQSSRMIGLIQSDHQGSYGLFIWNNVQNNTSNNINHNQNNNDIIETIIPIDNHFHYQLVTLDPILLEISENGTDLALFISYDCRPTSTTTTTTTNNCSSIINNNNNNNSINNDNDSDTNNRNQSINDSILKEYDPLMSDDNNNDNNNEKSNNDHHQSVSSTSSLLSMHKQSYRFILSYNEMTEKFITQLQHIVSVSHRTSFVSSIDFEWTKQYYQQMPLNKQQQPQQTIVSSSSSSSSFSSSRLSMNDEIMITKRNHDQISCSSNDNNMNMNNNNDYNMTENNYKQQANSDNVSTSSSLINQFSEDKLIDIDDNNYLYHHRQQQQQQQMDESRLKYDLIQPESIDHFGDFDSGNFFNEINRELQIQTATEERRNEYVRYINYSLFIGTWNVNGQTMLKPDMMRTHFLSIDATAPDFYAIGFQELDLSKEAYLFNDNRKEDYWIQKCEQSLHPKRQYFLLKKIRLIGMMLVIFAAREFRKDIINVAAETVGTGILGKIGNKGGVAIRFEFYDTSICFVNCHLAAHVEQYERRNQDFREINSRLQFMNLRIPKRIYDHDQIYWFGDLNYRIMTSDTDYVKKLLKSSEFDKLLSMDQLRNQMTAKNCFQGFTEGKINFMPSYKYNTGTNEWDSSEKRRPPAWCDRILWRGENIQQTVYRLHPELKDSDHKPVSALFESQAMSIDHLRKRKVYEDVMKKLDKFENELLPQVSIDTTEICFGNVSFKDNSSRSLTLTNIGQSRIRFKFINKPNDLYFCKPWLRVTPSSGVIKVKEEITIIFELNFDDASMAYCFNYGHETLNDTLVLSLIGGKDIFITIFGDYHLSCFGCSLQTLVRLKEPIKSLTLKEFQEKFKDYQFQKLKSPKEQLIDIITSIDDNQETQMKQNNEHLTLPKELFMLIDHLLQHSHLNVNIFQTSGMENEFFMIRNALDSCDPKLMANVSENSVAEALLLFLETLPEPIIPYVFYDRIQNLNRNCSQCKQIYNELNIVHRKVFHYLIKFLQEICNNSESDKLLNKLYIAKLFAPILIRKPPESFYCNADNKTKQQQQKGPTTSTLKQSSSTSSLMNFSMYNNNNNTKDYKQNLNSLMPEQFFVNYFLNLNTW